MDLFFSDLDNTMIYSYHHELGKEKQCVEWYQGREISFMTERTLSLMQCVLDRVHLVPLTTRTEEQYARIQWQQGSLPYALVCNGGVLLVHGKEEEDWYRQSRVCIRESETVLKEAEILMQKDKNRIFEVRNIRNLFLFTKCEHPKQSVAYLRDKLDVSLVEVFHNGIKVYVVPKRLSKGAAVKRFREYIGEDRVIAAGDSAFDVSMLWEADIPIAPRALYDTEALPKRTVVVEKEQIFSESVLEYILSRVCPKKM